MTVVKFWAEALPGGMLITPEQPGPPGPPDVSDPYPPQVFPPSEDPEIVNGTVQDPNNIVYQPDHINSGTGATLLYDLSVGSGSRHIATLEGTANMSTAQQPFGSGASMVFAGVGNKISIPNSAEFAPSTAEIEDTGEFMFEMWIRPTVLGQEQVFFSRYDAGANDRVFQFEMDAANKLKFRASRDGITADNLCNIVGTNALSLNTWHHVAVSRENGQSETPTEEDRIAIFLDGTLEASQQVDDQQGLEEAAAAAIYFGGLDDTGREFDGQIYGARIVIGEFVYNADFTAPTADHAGERDDLTAMSDPTFSTVSLLVPPGVHLNTTFTDVSDNTHTPATFNDAVHNNGSEAISGDVTSILFDGTGDYIEVPDHATLDLTTGDYYMDCWIKMSADGVFLAKYRINQRAFLFRVFSKQVMFQHFKDIGSSANTALVSDFSGDADDDVWRHVLLSKEDLGGSFTIRLFVDGIHQSSWSSGDVDLMEDSTEPVSIGAYESGIAPITGRISHVRIVKGAGPTASFLKPTAAPPQA